MRIPFKSLAVLLFGGAAFAASALGSAPLNPAPGNLPAPIPQQSMNTSVCASAKPPKGAAKFTGRIQATPSGTSFEVNSGKETAMVTYSGSTAICQGGQSAPPEALTPGLSLTVYGEMNRVGNTYRMVASLILLEGKAASTPRMTSNPIKTNATNNPGAAPPNDPTTNPTQTNTGTPSQNNSNSTRGMQTNTGDINKQGSQGRGGSGISCESMTFIVPGAGAGAPGLGKTAGRTQMDGVTCVMPVSQQSIQLMDDGMKGERMASVTLTWPNVFVVTLTNAFVSSVTYTSSGSQPVAQVTFQFTRIELQPAMGGTRISLEGKP
ncbi:MAG: type VI secretion system tube protein Hcp [Candidatus Acidiferrales bacterium]